MPIEIEISMQNKAVNPQVPKYIGCKVSVKKIWNQTVKPLTKYGRLLLSWNA